MAAMPFARLKRCLEVAVLYSSQQGDVNVSLTTISLLWNAADLFGKASAAPPRPGSASKHAPAAAAADDESDTEVEADVVAVPQLVGGGGGEELESEDEGASPSGKPRGQLAARLNGRAVRRTCCK